MKTGRETKRQNLELLRSDQHGNGQLVTQMTLADDMQKILEHAYVTDGH